MSNEVTATAPGVLLSGETVSRAISGGGNRVPVTSSRLTRSWLTRAWAGSVSLVVFASMLLGALCIPAQAQTLAPAWVQQTPAASPPARYFHALTYDSGHGQVVLFGGFGASSYLNDTWLWNGTNWAQANPANMPGLRAEHSMVYDPVHGQVVLFGGYSSAGDLLGDTWLWDGTNWTQANPATSPPARYAAAMAYDAATSQVLLFGGSVGSDLGDTWAWNGVNWIQQSPTNSPSPRNHSSMVYDSATNQVVLFGGVTNNTDVNDTWVWNGSNWIRQNPANSPPARDSHGMAYDAALSQVVVFGGFNGSLLNDTWTYSGTTWTQDNTATSPFGRYIPNAMTYDAAQGQVLLFGGLGDLEMNDTWEWGSPGNFGNVNVCPSEQTTTTLCSSTVAFTYNLASPMAFEQPQIVTQGATGLDFTIGSGNTCIGKVIHGSCTVNVVFAPIAPGLRTGVIQLFDGSGRLVATSPVYGVGQAPAAAFGPGTQSLVNTTANYPLFQPKGVTVDAAGDVFIADNGNRRVVKIAANGTVSTVGVGLEYPQGMAVDGAGDLFIADNVLNEVVEVPAGCTTAACQTTVGVGLAAQLGVAVDGAGDLFLGDFTGNEVVEVPVGCTSAACQTVVYGHGIGSNPVGLAVDAAGDVFVADFGLGQVVEIPAGCTSNSCQVQIGQGWVQPEAVAVDAAGDVFVADQYLHVVAEVPAGCSNSSCQVTVASEIVSYGIALDGMGDLFIADLDGSRLIEMNRAQPPTLRFAATDVGSTSSDSPQSLSIQNIGNQALNAVPPGVSSQGANFAVVPVAGNASACPADFALAPGASCNAYFDFTPTAAGPLSNTATVTDNALNVPGALQYVPLAGVGVSTTFPLTVTEIGAGSGTVTDNSGQIACIEDKGVTTGTCGGSYSVPVTLTARASGTSIFLGWGGVCASAGTNATCVVTLSQASNATASFVNQSFGGVSVCPLGSAQQGCGATLPITYNLTTTTTIGAIKVVTQGAAGLDFTLGNGSTCTGTVAGGNSCNVSVNFAPLGPGLRMGAVELYDNNASLVASTPVYGIGQESAIAFSPGTFTATSVAAVNSGSAAAVAVDAAGDSFLADGTNNVVVKLTPAGGQTSVASTGLNGPAGLAIDGAGDLFIASAGNNQVLEVTPSGAQTTVVTPGYTLLQPHAVAVDGAGNLFIADTGNGRVVEILGKGGVALVGTGLKSPSALAVSAAGSLYIVDTGLKQVLLVANGAQIVVNSGLTNPTGVAVDAAGDVYVADSVDSLVVEVTSTGLQKTLLYSVNGVQPNAIAVDAFGNLVLASNLLAYPLVKASFSQPPALSFPTTNVGSTSAGGPQTIQVQNAGNQPLTGSLALKLGANFTQSATPDCAATLPLAPGALCEESFSFAPQSANFFSGTATFSDNSLNASPFATQTILLSGTGAIDGVAGTVAVPNVVGQAQAAATTPISAAGLAMGTVSTASSLTVPSGSIISENPVAGTQVSVGSPVNLLVSSGLPQPPPPNPLSLENNYFLTGDYVSAGVTLRGTGNATSHVATGTITIPNYTQSATEGVPDGADIVDAFLYWESLENTASASSTNGMFNGYPIVGQQIGSDQPDYTDGGVTGTLRAYRASVNIYLPVAANGIRIASGTYTVALPDSGGNTYPLTEGASLVLIYRVLSPNFPLKSVVIYDGAAVPAGGAIQVVKGFYDAVGGANGTGKNTNLFASGGNWNKSVNSVTLGQSNQYTAPLNASAAYTAVILSTPVNNSDNDGILDAWKAGPTGSDFHAGQPGYYDVKTSTWVGLPGAKHGQKDLFVQMDYMCGAILASGSCDPAQENLFPSPDAGGNDPLAIVQQAFAQSGVQLHLEVGNAVPETTCADSPGELCQFPGEPGVIGWKNSLEFSKLYPRNLLSCITGGDCTTRFPYGQKDSYHYVLFGHSLAIPAYNSRYGSLTSISVANGVTTITTIDRGTGIYACPSRITIEGVLGNPGLNGVYDTTTPCADSKTITVATPGVPNWSYPNNTLPEPVIGITFGKVTSISGYSDLGGADSAVTLGLWLTDPGQDMSKRVNVLAGTLFHEIGHTLGLSHGGLYYDTPGSYLPTFEANCKPNYQSIMNYLFQLDGVGLNEAVAFSNQALTTVNETIAGSVTQLTDASGNPATFSDSAWYSPFPPGSMASAATLHCDGTPLNGEVGYRVDASVSPIPAALGWTNGQDLDFIGTLQTEERGFNDLAALDLRQVGATGGEFASLASELSFGNSTSPLNIGAGGTVALGSGGTVALGSGGTITLGSGGNVTLGSGGTITLGSGGNVTFASGGNVTLGSGGATLSPGGSGTVTLGSGGTITLSSGGGTITLGSGGTITLGSGGTVTLGSGGTIALGSGGSVTIPSSGGSYTIDGSGGTITLGSGGNVTLGSGGNVTLGSGGTVALGSGGNVTLGSGGTVTLGSGGTVTLGSGGTVTLGSGGNVTLGSGGTIALGSGGTVTLGSGGTVTLGSGGTVTLGSGGNVALGSGGNVTLGSGGSATLGAGGTVTLGSGGTVALGSGGTVTLGSGGTVTLGSGGTLSIGAGGSYTFGSSGGTVTLGSGGTVTLGSGGTVTLGSGGVVTLGSGGSVNLGSGSAIPLGTVSNITSGSGGPSSTELTYETANSVVRAPSSPTETSTPTSVTITWKAPAFGVVARYTIYRSSDGATPIVIGSVSGVNGNPPATEFTDTNPDQTSKTVVYTIATTLVPDTAGGTQRTSQQSGPAMLKNDQTISLGPLPSSVLITTPSPTVTATALSGGVANGLQVIFSATGSCAVGSQSVAGNVSSATLIFSGPGSCTIIASQPGTTAFNAANPVSGTFVVLPQGSTIKSQTISFAPLPNALYGGSFTLSATSSSGFPVSFTAAGPCTTSGGISGIGVCSITASVGGNSRYSAASLTQSFTVYPAVLKVSANNLASTYGQPLPSLTYSYTGFVNGDATPVVSGAPALSTTATATSNAGSYPITVATGTLATTNYSFLYVSGTLTIQPANQPALSVKTSSPLTFHQSETLSVAGGTTGGAVTYHLIGGQCALSGNQLRANSGTGRCEVTATMAGNANYNPVTSPASTVTLAKASQAITFTSGPPASAAYTTSFTVAVTGGASGNVVAFTSAGVCVNSGATFTMTNSTGTCSVIANQAGDLNYMAAPQVTKSVSATGPSITVSPSSINFGTVYLDSFTIRTVTVTNAGTYPATLHDPLVSLVSGGNSEQFVEFSLCPRILPAGRNCTVAVAFIAGPFYTPQTATLQIMDNAPGNPQQVPLSAVVIDPEASFSATGLSFETVEHATSSTLDVTLSNPGATPLIFSSGIGVTGANAAYFSQSSNCGSSLAAGAHCTVAVKFTPPTAGTFGATLSVVDNAQAGKGTQSISLTGKRN